MLDEPEDGVSYSTEVPEWIEREARRLRNQRRLEYIATGCEIALLIVAMVFVASLIF